MANSFGEPVPDQTGELRLQLRQALDQRDAFKALAHRDVLAVIREASESSLHATIDDLKAKVERITALYDGVERNFWTEHKANEATLAENQQLKERLERLEKQKAVFIDREKILAENQRLCERLQDLNGEVHTASCANANAHKEIERLKAEVERLRAGINHATQLMDSVEAEWERIQRRESGGCDIMYAVQAWKRAKEGKPMP